MNPIKNIVTDVIARMASGKGGNFEDIQETWGKISKDQESKITNFKEGTLTVSAPSSMRLVKLNLNRESLLKELQKDFPSVVKISFKVGK